MKYLEDNLLRVASGLHHVAYHWNIGSLFMAFINR